MSPDIQWFMADGKSPVGPMGWEDLREKVRSGSLTLRTKIWHKGLGEWSQAERVIEVAQLIADVVREQRSAKRWMVVVDKKVNKQPQGLLSDDEVEANLAQGVFHEKTLYWTQGQPSWLTLDKIEALAPVKARADAARLALPPLIEDEVPVVPEDDSPPSLDDQEEPRPLMRPFTPVFHLEPKTPTDDLIRGLEAVFAQSKWIGTVRVLVGELARGIETGDVVKIDGAIDRVRLFLQAEMQPERASRHPCMSEDGLRFVATSLIALASDPVVKSRVQHFDPLYTRSRGGAPSVTANRTRVLLGTSTERPV